MQIYLYTITFGVYNALIHYCVQLMLLEKQSI